MAASTINWTDIQKKAGIYGTIDMLWQYGAQYPDRLSNTTGEVCAFKGLESLGINDGHMMPADITALLYPFMLAFLAYQLSKAVFKDDEKKDDNSKEIALTVFRGITGWTMGWYVSENEDWGMWGDVAAVGVGAAATGLLSTVGYQLYNNKFGEKECKSALSVAGLTCVAGAAWLASYMAPSLVGGNKVEQEIMRSVAAPMMSFLVTAACVAIALYYDQKSAKSKIKS